MSNLADSISADAADPAGSAWEWAEKKQPAESGNRAFSVLTNARKKIGRVFTRGLAVILFFAFWEIAPHVGLADPIFVPPLDRVLASLWTIAQDGTLLKDIAISLQRAVLGFGISVVIAVPLGLIIGWFKKAERFLDPLLQLFRQTSPLALLPVFILIFHIGEVSKVAIIFWGVQWPILLNTIAGVKSVDPLYIKSARSMGASPFTLFTRVILPGASPMIFSGIRLSATSAIVLLTAAEMIGANSGLGFLIYYAQQTFKIPEMYAAILMIAVLGVIVNYLLVAIEKQVLKWREELPESVKA